MVQGEDVLTVKDLTEILETEAYVLRFYEKELKLKISRNNKGHRIYSLEDVETFRKIQKLREKGLQLKAIENIIHSDGEDDIKQIQDITKSSELVGLKPPAVKKSGMLEEIDISNSSNEKVKQFSDLMKDVLKQALGEYSENSKNEIKEELQKEMTNTVEDKFTKLEEKQDCKNKEYYKKLDETIREVQQIRKEMVDTGKEKPKKRFWSKLFGDKETEETVDI